MLRQFQQRLTGIIKSHLLRQTSAFFRFRAEPGHVFHNPKRSTPVSGCGLSARNCFVPHASVGTKAIDHTCLMQGFRSPKRNPANPSTLAHARSERAGVGLLRTIR
jgi:hypothetical protein